MSVSMQEVVDMLTDCELSNLLYVDVDTNVVDTVKLPKLIRSINLGVLELHKRFFLKEGYVKVQLNDSIHRYYLRPAYQVGNQRPRPNITQYIQQEGDKLADRSILKIESIFNAKGAEWSVNELNDIYSVTTPSSDIIEISDALLKEHAGQLIKVKFRMAPKRVLLEDDFDPDDLVSMKVDIPYTHLQALIWFVASRSHNSIGFAENTTNEANNYGNKFEMECSNLDVLNYRVDQQGGTGRLRRGGWV